MLLFRHVAVITKKHTVTVRASKFTLDMRRPNLNP